MVGLFDRFRSPEERARRTAARLEKEARQREAALQKAAADAVEARRAADEQAAAAAAAERARVIDVLGEDLAAMDVDTPEQAKLAIKMARLRKRELQAERRVIAQRLADHREDWRERTAGRYSTIALGRGTAGRMIRAGIQANRRSERQAHADVVNDFSDQKQLIDEKILAVDRLLIELEQMVLE